MRKLRAEHANSHAFWRIRRVRWNGHCCGTDTHGYEIRSGTRALEYSRKVSPNAGSRRALCITERDSFTKIWRLMTPLSEKAPRSYRWTLRVSGVLAVAGTEFRALFLGVALQWQFLNESFKIPTKSRQWRKFSSQWKLRKVFPMHLEKYFIFCLTRFRL